MSTADIESANLGERSESSSWPPAVAELVTVVPQLSLARDLDTVMKIVRTTARRIADSDGSTFVLRDGDRCYYADEDAIAPLWKGKRFPMSACISGWSMEHRESVYIPDIYQDPRIPADAYRPTFVHSLLMMPIRVEAPIGAIGNYWANEYHPSDQQIRLLEALANATSLALENIRLYADLNRRMEELEQKNEHLAHFAWAAAHDYQEPLRNIIVFLEKLERHLGDFADGSATRYLEYATRGARNLRTMTSDMLSYSRVDQIQPEMREVSLADALDVAEENLAQLIQETDATVVRTDLPTVFADQTMVVMLLQNLISNGIKFARSGVPPVIRIEADVGEWDCTVSVSDNGCGIDESYCDKVFDLFFRLNPKDQIPGSGMGLATCRKIIELLGGEIGVRSIPGSGSTFFFTLRRFADTGT